MMISGCEKGWDKFSLAAAGFQPDTAANPRRRCAPVVQTAGESRRSRDGIPSSSIECVSVYLSVHGQMNVVVEGCAVVGEGGGCGQLASFLGAKPPAKALKFKDDEGHIWVGIGKRPEWCKAALAAGKTPVKCSNAGSSALCVTPDFEGLMARRGGITSGASCPMLSGWSSAISPRWASTCYVRRSPRADCR